MPSGRASFNLIHQRTMVKIDVFVAKARPYDRSALDRRWRESLGDLDLFAASGRVSERQWGDVLGILRVQGGALDLAYLRRWGAELGVAALLERSLDEAARP